MDLLRELEALIKPLGPRDFAAVGRHKLTALHDELARLRKFEPCQVPSVKLTRTQEKLYEAVKADMPRGASRDRLVDVLYGGRADGGADNDRVTLRTHIYKLNLKLRPLGCEITAQSADAMRYRLVAL